MKMPIASPENANFNFFNEISISIGAGYLEEVVIASKSNIQENGSVSLEMNVDGSVQGMSPKINLDSPPLQKQTRQLTKIQR